MNHESVFNLLLTTVGLFSPYSEEAHLKEWLSPCQEKLARFTPAVLAKHAWKLKRLQVSDELRDTLIRNLVRQLRLLGMKLPMPIRAGRIVRRDNAYAYIVCTHQIFLENGQTLRYVYRVLVCTSDFVYIATEVGKDLTKFAKFSRLPKAVKAQVESGKAYLKKSGKAYLKKGKVIR